ncbi:hypothetical protein Q9189_007630 [Teloschistes chrysophthalmus]
MTVLRIIKSIARADIDPMDVTLSTYDFLLDNLNLDMRAKSLLQRLPRGFACENPKSSITGSIYNTAWISMIRKPVEGISHWLFPRAFTYILQRQW